ncbi:MAG: chemotaxis protein CheW [Solirubrobacteraceae bacterium]
MDSCPLSCPRGAEQYALPIKQVQEIIRYQQPRSVASHDYSACGVISLSGRLVAVHDLAARLGAEREHDQLASVRVL